MSQHRTSNTSVYLLQVTNAGVGTRLVTNHNALQALDLSIEEYVHNLRLPSKAKEVCVAHMYGRHYS